MYNTTVKVGDKEAFGLIPLKQAIANGVGNRITISQFFDTNLNTAAQVVNRTALKESCKQRVVARLLILNYKYKSVKNKIQRRQTHERPDANGAVPSLWPDNISKSLAIVMMHEQTAKQNNGGGDSPSKKNNPRRKGAIITLLTSA